ncbi:MAG: DUF6434 domain-containing protein [Pseudomonadota bacterium]
MSDQADDATRPEFYRTMRAEEFDRWYWPKTLLEEISRELELPLNGNKAQLRVNILFRLKHSNARLPKTPRADSDGFNWSTETLTPDTVITESITFGPNVRGFFKHHIGPLFSCHRDFMDWARANAGQTLQSAIDVWHALEARKDDPSFRREIAEYNNYLRYLRDFQDHFPNYTRDEAKTCWDAKKIRPAQNGQVVFELSDLRFLSGSPLKSNHRNSDQA